MVWHWRHAGALLDGSAGRFDLSCDGCSGNARGSYGCVVTASNAETHVLHTFLVWLYQRGCLYQCSNSMSEATSFTVRVRESAAFVWRAVC